MNERPRTRGRQTYANYWRETVQTDLASSGKRPWRLTTSTIGVAGARTIGQGHSFPQLVIDSANKDGSGQ